MRSLNPTMLFATVTMKDKYLATVAMSLPCSINSGKSLIEPAKALMLSRQS